MEVSMFEALTTNERKQALDALLAFMVRIYNSGYCAGHNDTVEGGYVDIHRDDMETYHAETVEEIIAEANILLDGSRPPNTGAS
jgi:hypothetical protein